MYKASFEETGETTHNPLPQTASTYLNERLRRIMVNATTKLGGAASDIVVAKVAVSSIMFCALRRTTDRF